MARKQKASAAAARESDGQAGSTTTQPVATLQYLPDDILLKILGYVAEKRSAELLAAMWTSRRLRGLARHATLWAEPLFGRQDSPRLFMGICESLGASFRRVCLSALPQISANDAIRGLGHAKSITHLSLAYFADPEQRETAAHAERARPKEAVFNRLPKLSHLEHLNLTGVRISPKCLKTTLQSCASTLERLYCCNTMLTLDAEERKRLGGGSGGIDWMVEGNTLVPVPTPSAKGEPPGSIVPVFAGFSLPKLAQLDLSGIVCSEAGMEALVFLLPALTELFLVAPRKMPQYDLFDSLVRRWDPEPLARRLTSKRPELSVVVENFMDIMCKAIIPSRVNAGTSTESAAQLWTKAAGLLPVVRRCSGVDAPMRSGTLLHHALQFGRFAAAVRLVDEFGSSPLALAKPGSFCAQSDPWVAPYPVQHSRGHGEPFYMYERDVIPGQSVLHLTCSASIEDRPADQALVEELPEIFRRWGLAKHVNLRTEADLQDAPLHVSIKRNSPQYILPLKPEVLLEMGADPSVQNAGGQTTAHVLAGHPDPDLLKLLLERSPQIANLADDSGKTPLHSFLDRMAVGGRYNNDSDNVLHEEASAERVQQCVQILLDLESPRVNAGLADKRGRTALHSVALGPLSIYGRVPRRAACIALIRTLLGRPDVDPNAKDDEGCTPLFLAAGSEHDEIVQALLEAGAGRVQIDAAANDGRTPLFHACEKKHASIVRRLLEAGADPNRRPEGRVGPLRTFLCDRQPNRGEPDYASVNVFPSRPREELAATRALFLAKGAQEEVFDEHGRTALHIAADREQQNRRVAGQDRNMKDCLADEAYPAGALAARTPAGETPLIVACKSGNRKAALACLEHSPLLAADLEGATALHRCIPASQELMGSIAPAILEMCPEAAKAVDIDGRTPLHLFATITYGSKHPVKVARALVPLSDLTAQDSQGRTPLHVAAKSTCLLTTLEAMLAHPQAAAAFAMLDKTGCTPLHLACRYQCSAEHVRLMLEAGAPAATARDSEGRLAAEVAPPALRHVMEKFVAEGPEAGPSSKSGPPANTEAGAEAAPASTRAGRRGRKRPESEEEEEAEDGGSDAAEERPSKGARRSSRGVAARGRERLRREAAAAAAASEASKAEGGQAEEDPAPPPRGRRAPRRAAPAAEEEEQPAAKRRRGRAAGRRAAESEPSSSSEEESSGDDEEEGEGPAAAAQRPQRRGGRRAAATARPKRGGKGRK